jgi:hypothetical protein
MSKPSDAAGVRPTTPPAQVGKRPSNPGFLLVLGVLWFGAGIVALIALHVAWRLVPGIVFIGIGSFYLRGGIVAANRRQRR